MKDTIMQFDNREDFRSWLTEHCLSSEGVWLLFGKTGGPVTLKASEALEEALCFGWIDGVMKSIDEHTYKKYFSIRRAQSKWSDKNKALVEQLEKQGMMSEYGRQKIAEAKQNGQWAQSNTLIVSEDDILMICEILQNHEPAYSNFMAMSASVRKTYAKAYLDAKTDAGREKRLTWMIDRLNKNLKPM